MTVHSPTDVAAAAQLACLLEASAPKPGNVSPGRPFADTRYEDFLASAAAIGVPLAGAHARPLGETVRLAVEATARWTAVNTNLGIVLLLAPLARAALRRKWGRRSFFEDTDTPSVDVSSKNDLRPHLRQELTRVLEETTVEDASHVYAAIRLAAPGGLGRVEAQDVSGEPDVTLLHAMRLAAHRDAIAREYATAFQTTFETGVPALDLALGDGLRWPDAVVETFLKLLAESPDTHIARRGGAAMATEVTALARRVLAAGGVRSEAGRKHIDGMDQALRDAGNIGNPGATADLTAAVIFVALLGGGFSPGTDGG